MTNAIIEHANLTVKNMPETAALLCELFDWKMRWEGTAGNGDHSVHIGGESSYLALCDSSSTATPVASSFYDGEQVSFNHIGIVVDDLEQIEQRVKDAGLTPHSHGDYEPGRRFYFATAAGLEVEVISYK